MRQPFTTTLAMTCIVLGALGIWLSSVTLLIDISRYVQGDELRLVENMLSILTKCGFAIAGIFMLCRSRATWIVFAITTVVSAIDSVMLYLWFPTPIPTSLSPEGQSARAAGQIVGLFLGPALYLMMISYQFMCKAEFSGKSTVPPVVDVTIPATVSST